jgi:uncharacterized membrane protein (UPF0127 family)
MPNNETAKTKWAHKYKTLFWWVTGVLVLFWGAAILWLPWAPYSSRDYKLKVYHHPDTPSSHVGPLKSQPWVYYLRGAVTPDEQSKGLGGTKDLKANRGMIFLYNDTAQRCFWMKDMNYAIDMIWADDARNITAIEHSVDPETYPDTFCHDGRYVVELRAGEAKKAGLEEGAQLNF